MTALEDAAALATDSRLIGPLTAAIVRAAVDILAEDVEAPNHGERASLARQLVQEPGAYQERFAWAVSTNPAVVGDWAAGNLDAAFDSLQYVVDTVWDHIAGV